MKLGRYVPLVLLVANGCIGVASEPELPDPGINASAYSWVPAPTGDCSQVQVGQAPLRRLTAEQYTRAVNALVLGVELKSPGLEPTPALGFADDINRLAISADLLEAYLEDAESAAKELARSEGESTFVRCAVGDGTCANELIRTLGRQAFRRPLEEAEVQSLLGTFNRVKLAGETDMALELTLMRLLLSPYFLYRVELGDSATDANGLRQLTPFEIASRLSFLYEGGPPSAELLDLAESGDLARPEVVSRVTWSLVFDDAGRPTAGASRQLRAYLNGWLGRGRLDDLGSEIVDPDLLGLLRAEIDFTLDQTAWGRRGGVAELLAGGLVFVNGPLAQHYGMSGVTGSAFQQVEDERRVGLLTQGGFALMAGQGPSTSIIRRGVFVNEQLGCVQFPQPPASAMAVAASLPPNLSPREQAAAHKARPGCSACHDLFDPVGINLSRVDELGRFREVDADQVPVDDSADVKAFDLDEKVDGVQELSQRLATSDSVRTCASAWMFRFAYSRLPTSVDGCAVHELAASGDSFVEQWLSLAHSPAFTTIPIPILQDPTARKD